MGFNFEDLVNGVEGAISQAADAVSDAVDYVSDEVSDAVDYVSDEVSDAVDYVSDEVSDAVDYVSDEVSDAVDYVSDEVSDAVDYVSDEVSDAVDYVSDEVSDAVDYVSDEVSDAVLGAKAVVANACEDLECDAEELLEESHKLFVGAWIATENEFNNIANFISYSNDLTEKAKERSDEIERQANEQMIDAVKNKLNNIGDFITYSNELNEQAKERSDEIERQANEQMIDAVKNKLNNIGEFISYSNELNEQAKERSDEIERQGNEELINYAKNEFNNGVTIVNKSAVVIADAAAVKYNSIKGSVANVWNDFFMPQELSGELSAAKVLKNPVLKGIAKVGGKVGVVATVMTPITEYNNSFEPYKDDLDAACEMDPQNAWKYKEEIYAAAGLDACSFGFARSVANTVPAVEQLLPIKNEQVNNFFESWTRNVNYWVNSRNLNNEMDKVFKDPVKGPIIKQFLR